MLFRRKFVGILFKFVGILFIGLLVGAMASCVGPPRVDSTLQLGPDLQDGSPLYIHGAGDSAKVWAEAWAQEEGGYALDWASEAADKLAAPRRGYQLGLSIARTLSTRPRVIYAHSAGAWLAQGIADGLALRSQTEEGIILPDIIFLDPFTAMSAIEWGTGRQKLGLHTHFTETYYTTQDSIPFTGGEVAQGRRVNLDIYLNKGTAAHWDVITWYRKNRPGL